MRIPYECSECGAGGCKLWRLYQTFLDHQTLLCFFCTLRDQWDSLEDPGGGGDPGGGSIRIRNLDNIGGRVAAVPTEDGETFWGYTSVPEAGVKWWRGLPTLPPRPTKPSS